MAAHSKDGRPASPVRTARPETQDASWASSLAVRRRMQRQPTRDTAPELALRKALHAAGLRYRVDTPPLPGLRRRADVVFTRARVAVFVDGCFWHGCPQHGSRTPHANAGYWTEKIHRNRQRDADTDSRLHQAGWLVLRLWEHDDPAAGAAAAAALHALRTTPQEAPCR